jgi:hypothetical protein
MHSRVTVLIFVAVFAIGVCDAFAGTRPQSSYKKGIRQVQGATGGSMGFCLEPARFSFDRPRACAGPLLVNVRILENRALAGIPLALDRLMWNLVAAVPEWHAS